LCHAESDLRFGVRLYDPLVGEIVTINMAFPQGQKSQKMPAYFTEAAERIGAWQAAWRAQGNTEELCELGNKERHLTATGCG
jgi:hypothetical protein